MTCCCPLTTPKNNTRRDLRAKLGGLCSLAGRAPSVCSAHSEMARKIKGNHDGPNGGNDSYSIAGRGDVSRRKLVAEIKQGQHPDFSTYERNGVIYVRAKPDHRKGNNIND